MIEISKDDAQLLLSGLGWMCSEGAAEHQEVAHLVRRIIAVHPDLTPEYDYLLDD